MTPEATLAYWDALDEWIDSMMQTITDSPPPGGLPSLRETAESVLPIGASTEFLTGLLYGIGAPLVVIANMRGHDKLSDGALASLWHAVSAVMMDGLRSELDERSADTWIPRTINPPT